VTINDSYFAIVSGNGLMKDWPALYHNNCSGISFADGHAILQLWKYLGLPPGGASYNPNNNNYLTGQATNDVNTLYNYAFGK